MNEEFRYIELAHKTDDGKFIRFTAGSRKEAAWFIRKYGPKAMFATAYIYKSKDKSGAMYAPYFYIDLDNSNLTSSDPDVAEAAWVEIRRDYLFVCNILDAFYGIRKDYVLSYFSGKKGLTILVPTRIFGLEPSENINEVFRLLAKEIASTAQSRKIVSIDTAIYDRSRLLRLPNTMHEATGLYKVRLYYDEIRNLSYREIIELAGQPRPNPLPDRVPVSPKAKAKVSSMTIEQRDRRKEFKYEAPCVKKALAEGAVLGRRNNTAIALASYFYQCGMEYGEALQILLDWGRNKCSPPMNGDEIEATVRSAYRNQYAYGCRTFKSLDLCKPEGCEIEHYRNAVSMDRANNSGTGRDNGDNRARQKRAYYRV